MSIQHTARDSRRHKALVARIKASDIRNITDLDFSDPLFQAATIGEITLALQTAIAASVIPFENIVTRWMGSEAEWNSAGGEQWMPLKDALFHDLHLESIVSDVTFMLMNAITAVQVCYARLSPGVYAYHMQMLNDPSIHGYYKIGGGPAQRMDGDMPGDLPSARTPFGRIGAETITIIRNWTQWTTPPEQETTLHDSIKKSIGIF